MIFLFLISVTITAFLIAAVLIVLLGGKETIDARLMEISAPPPVISPDLVGGPTNGLARAAAGVTSDFKTLRGMVSGSDENLAYRMASVRLHTSECCG